MSFYQVNDLFRINQETRTVALKLGRICRSVSYLKRAILETPVSMGSLMAKSTYFMQLGMGSDLHGSDNTKAAVRAVNAAIRDNNMLFLKHVKLPSPDHLLVSVVIATPNPDAVDTDAVSEALPIGKVSVEVQPGGMLVDADQTADPVLVAIASVTISIEH